MQRYEPYDYLHVVEWDFSPSLVIHAITIGPEVKGQAFEDFMATEGLPAAAVQTRGGGVTAQWLLRDTTGSPPLRFEDSDLELDGMGTRVFVRKFEVVKKLRER
jgi:hypothetical protein